MTCEAIINQVDCTVICVSNDTVENLREIKNIYALAEKLAPTLMIIEDIDTLGGLDRRDGASHPLLGELLASLNGLGLARKCGDCGHHELPSISRPRVSRPTRSFDIRVEFPIRDVDLRRAILKKYLSKFKTGRISIDKIAKGSEGLTGAYLREVVTTAYLITIENGDEAITAKSIR